MLIGLHWSNRVCHVDEVETNTVEVEETNVVEVTSFVLLTLFFRIVCFLLIAANFLNDFTCPLVDWLSVLI